MNEDKIKSEAVEIMNNFMKALDKIQVEEEFVLMRENSFREEGKDIEKVDSDNFKQRFLSNASKTKGDAILANKGNWVE